MRRWRTTRQCRTNRGTADRLASSLRPATRSADRSTGAHAAPRLLATSRCHGYAPRPDHRSGILNLTSERVSERQDLTKVRHDRPDIVHLRAAVCPGPYVSRHVDDPAVVACAAYDELEQYRPAAPFRVQLVAGEQRPPEHEDALEFRHFPQEDPVEDPLSQRQTFR